MASAAPTERATPSQQGMLGSAAVFDGWPQNFLNFSVFSFSSPDLEHMYQRYLANNINLWTWSACVGGGFVWTGFALKYLAFPQERGNIPPGAFLALMHPLSAATLMSIMLFKPAFYARHHRVVKAVTISSILFAARPARAVLMWYKSIGAKPGAPPHWQQGAVKAFFTENIDISGMVWNVLALPIGQLPDLLIGVLFMISGISGNRYICGLRGVADNLVTMEPGLLSVVETASLWLRGVGGPPLDVSPSSARLSCPTALAFWQLTGCVFACVLVFLADALRRRAFLRTSAAKAVLGPEFETAALRWPFLDRSKLERGIAVGFCIFCFSASVVWTVVLDSLT